MKNNEKTKERLVHEISELRSQNAELKKSITGSISAEVAAEEASSYAESIVETVREPLLVLDADLKIISANRNFYGTFDVTPGETIGSFIYDLGNRQWDIPELRELLEEVLPEKQAFDDFEVDHYFQDIGHKTMLLNARQIHRRDIGAKIILLAIEDITARKEIEDGLEKTRKELETINILENAAREYAESVINTIREPLIALDQDLRVVTASRSFYNFFKVKPEETVGQLIYDLGNKQWNIAKLRELLETILPEKAIFDDYEVEHDFATIGSRTMLLNARQIERVLGKERIILLAIEDITERKQSAANIQQMAHHDSLTGLPNRKLFSDRLGIALSQAKRNQKEVGIAMLDLDNFKDVNDTLGHDVGDRLLKATAERLSAALRKGDTVARFGGDEFVLIISDLDVIGDAIQVAQKIVDSLSKPSLIDTHQLVVTASIGIAVYPGDGIDEGILLKNADLAMYQAKQAGRARYQFCKKT